MRRREDCAECGGNVNRRERPRSPFCSEKCRYRQRDRLRYQADPETQREKGRRYYRENREQVLARAAEKRRG